MFTKTITQKVFHNWTGLMKTWVKFWLLVYV